MELIYTEPTPDNRDRLYARIETQRNRDTDALSNIRFGTISKEYVQLDPVKEGEYESGRIKLDEIEEYYSTQIQEDFKERPLEGFVEELVDRTPYTRKQAEIAVAYGWFNLSVEDAIQTINQHLREIYDEISRESFDQTVDEIVKMRQKIENALEYPSLAATSEIPEVE